MTSRAAIALLVLVPLAGCGGGTKTSAIPSSGSAAIAKTSTGTNTSAAPAETAPAGCTAVTKPPAKPDGTLPKPTLKLNPKRKYTATVKTNCGTFAFTL